MAVLASLEGENVAPSESICRDPCRPLRLRSGSKSGTWISIDNGRGRQLHRDGPSIKPRGNVPGPVVTIEKPGGLAKLSSPISFAVKFAAFAGAKVDVSSTRIIYLKDPWIDLTQRVIDNVGANVFTTTGFSFSDAEVVEGTHTIRIEVRDTDGRVGFSTITFAVR
jgi:hypothetical protein